MEEKYIYMNSYSIFDNSIYIGEIRREDSLEAGDIIVHTVKGEENQYLINRVTKINGLRIYCEKL